MAGGGGEVVEAGGGRAGNGTPQRVALLLMTMVAAARGEERTERTRDGLDTRTQHASSSYSSRPAAVVFRRLSVFAD